MTDPRKSAIAKRRRRRPSGEFDNEGKANATPTVDMIRDNTSTVEAAPPVELAASLDPYEARKIEFDRPDGTRVEGYAIDDGRIDGSTLPDGWHKYSMMEDDDTGAVSIVPQDVHVNHRLDFVTDKDLGDGFDATGDDWGFTEGDLIDDMPDGFDCDEWLEDRRHRLLDQAVEDSDGATMTGERSMLLNRAVNDCLDHDPYNTSVGVYRIAKSTNPAGLGLEDMSEERIREAREYGGWDPDKHQYVHFNADGDLEGLSQEQADNLLWTGRRDILTAVRNDDDADPTLVTVLSRGFARG
ncbi:hypothetical protein [Bifidobacterium bifidum]|uniref:hypothetical protein n=1 Tax=Bifidobacterium bifidum TaxID=1681 RepID=UPI0011C0DCB3|nr:hypothetical protein [Bifidobacterium bifidum]